MNFFKRKEQGEGEQKEPEERQSLLYYLPLRQEKLPSSFSCEGKVGWNGCMKATDYPTCWTNGYFSLCEDCMRHYEIKKGMMLEAIDIQTKGFVCVASISNFDEEGNVRIHFDGWSTVFDYWCPRNHPNLATIGTSQKKGIRLHPPRGQNGAGWEGPGPFTWEGYLGEKGREGISEGFFEPSHAFWETLPEDTWRVATKEGCMTLREYDEYVELNSVRGMGIKGCK